MMNEREIILGYKLFYTCYIKNGNVNVFLVKQFITITTRSIGYTEAGNTFCSETGFHFISFLQRR